MHCHLTRTDWRPTRTHFGRYTAGYEIGWQEDTPKTRDCNKKRLAALLAEHLG
jgi:hypothetical protein